MPSPWLIEKVEKGATNCIIIGDVEESLLQREIQYHPQGLLHLTETKKKHLRVNNPKLIQLSLSDISDDKLFEITEGFIAQNYQSIPSAKVSASVEGFQDSIYKKAFDNITLTFDSTLRARITRKEMGDLKQFNILKNLAPYLSQRISPSLKGSLKDFPIVIIGAGPSLDISLPLIKEWKFPHYIIAADSAIKALDKTGIEPDFIVSIDPGKAYNQCANTGYKKGLAILNSTSHPSWYNIWKNDSRIISGNVLSEDWLENHGIQKTKVQAINNVGLTAIMLANFLGSELILLAGMDLSTESKSSGNRYASITERDVIIATNRSFSIPGNFQKTVETPFLSDWKDTANFCEKISSKKQIININDRGAVIAGSTLIHPNQSSELAETLISHFNKPKSASIDLSLTANASTEETDKLLTKLIQSVDWAKSIITPLLENNISEQQKLQGIVTIIQNEDISRFFGDYSFTVMPELLNRQNLTSQKLDEMLKRLQFYIWTLEDAVLKCNISEKFLSKFLLENV